MVPHVLAHIGPTVEQNALALVVAGPVLVGWAEVPGHDRAVDGADDLAEGDLLGRAGEDVAAPNAASWSARARLLLSASRICSRYGWGSPVRSAMSRTEVGVASSLSARESRARLA